MSSNYWKGVTIPDAGDDLLAAWPLFAQSAGIIQKADSIADMRTRLAAAEAAGYPPTVTSPAYFDMNGIIYRATGETGPNGVYNLKPVNEIEKDEKTFNKDGVTITRTAGAYSSLVKSTIPVRPYDRVFLAWGMMDGAIVDSKVDAYSLAVRIGKRDGNLGRWENNAEMQTMSSFNMGIVAAGVDPDVDMAVKAGSNSNIASLRISDSNQTNKLMVIAFPVSMN